MAKAGDIRITDDGAVYRWTEPAGWTYIGWIDIPPVGPALFQPGEYSEEEAGPILEALQTGAVSGTPPDVLLRERTGPVGPGRGGTIETAGAWTEPIVAGEREGYQPDAPLVDLVQHMSLAAGFTNDTIAAAVMESMGVDPYSLIKQYRGDPQRIAAVLKEQAATERGQTFIAAELMRLGITDDEGLSETEKSALGVEVDADMDLTALLGGGVGVGAEGAGVDYPPGEYFNWLKAQLMPGGPGTSGQYYDAISQMMMPLQGADELDFLSRFAQPGQYMPSTLYSLINKAMMPMGMNMPGEFYGMMEGAMPGGIAPGTPAPDFSFLGGLGQAPMPELGSFLVSLLQSNPELGLALMEAAIGMQQEYAMPFLPLLLGPAGQGGGAPVGQGDFSSALLGGAAPPTDSRQQLRGAERQSLERQRMERIGGRA